MKFLILNIDYADFLASLYGRNQGLENRSYYEQLQARYESLFGVADFYSRNLQKLGQEAYDVHVNNEVLQGTWAREHGMPVRESTFAQNLAFSASKLARRVIRKTPLKPLLKAVPRLLSAHEKGFYDILAAQIEHFKPDVLLNQAMGTISGQFLNEMKAKVRLLIGQIASPLPKEENLHCYDLVISSLPNFVQYFRRMGIPAELHRLGFEPEILKTLRNGKESIPVSFVGSVFQFHASRVSLLEYLCERLQVDVWAQGYEWLPETSQIRQRLRGSVWGLEMYQLLHDSEITLNHHIDLAEGYANNMRLFEATGVGTLLVTDWKSNLSEMFEPGKEVVAYRTPEECAELVRYYLEHEREREAIALAGQERTLREHTYYRRMEELIGIVRKYL